MLRVLVLTGMLMALLPAGAGQEGATPSIQDPAGDHVLELKESNSGFSQSAVSDFHDEVDILQVSLTEETEESFGLRMEVGGPIAEGAADGGLPVSRVYQIEFSFHGSDYRMRYEEAGNQISPGLPITDRRVTLELLNTPESAPRSLVYDLGETYAFTVQIPKRFVVGLNGEPTLAGTALEVRNVSSEARALLGCTFGPEGPEDCPYVIRDHVGAESLRLLPFLVDPTTDLPIHAIPLNPVVTTNGEAATHPFYLRLSNLQDQEVRVSFQFDEVPSTWDTYSPPISTLEPRSTRTEVLGIAVPFKHTHGEVISTNVTIRYDYGNVEGVIRVPLAIDWVDPAQLAGHHPELYFHPFDGSTNVRLSTEPSGPGLVPFEVGSCIGCGEEYVESSYLIRAEVIGGQRIGIDANMQEEGAYTILVESNRALDARVQGELRIFVPPGHENEGSTVLFSLPRQAIALVPGSNVLEGVILPLEAADYFTVPTTSTLRLFLELDVTELSMESILGGEPTLSLATEGSSLRFPVEEFVTKVPPEVGSSLQDLERDRVRDPLDRDSPAPVAGVLLLVGLLVLVGRARAR